MCEFCEGKQVDQEWDFKISMKEYSLLVEHECSECKDMDFEQFGINYCPMCGKKL